MASFGRTAADGNRQTRTPFPYARMQSRRDALDRLDLRFLWGGYGIHVLHCHLAPFPAGHVIPFHQHSEYEFHFIAQGRGKVTLASGAHELREGMFYLTGPGIVHQQESDQEDPMFELCLHCEIIPVENGAAEEQWGMDIERLEAEACMRILRDCSAEPLLDRYHAMPSFLNAYRIWEEQSIGFYTSIKQEIVQILVRAARAYRPDSNADAVSMPERDMTAHRCQLAVQYMENNASRPITLEEVSAAVGIGARTLQRIFLRTVGESFRDKLEDIRLTRVCHELEHSLLPVEEIAVRNGYANPNYLYPVFKNRYGMTPANYRKLAADGKVAPHSSGSMMIARELNG
jgi:AraC-like DNA-binding protein/mannose-6-phosphate isomerase-like protein (cupin superfamily)